MALAAPPTIPPAAITHPAVPSEPIYRLSVEQYHAMIQAGILQDGDPVELLEGWLVEKMPKNPQHSLATQSTRDFLQQLVPAGWFVNDQEPLTTLRSEPEPDVTVIRGHRRDYLTRHPKPQEIGLVIEVAESSIRRDRGFKQRIYAEAGIPTYWVINLVEGHLELFSDPAGSDEATEYRQHQVLPSTAEAPLVLDGREVGRVPVRELLP